MRIIKYPIDETYFQVIDTERKAYFLGLLYADGSMSKEHYHSLKIILQKRDLHILEELRKDIQPTKPFYYIKNGKYIGLDFTNKYLYSDLVELGCIPNKTHKLVFPTIDQKLIHHFIRGYYDGDGCLTGSFQKKYKINRVKKWKWSIVSTESFCKSVQNLITVHSKIDCRHPTHNNSTRNLNVCGRENIFNLLNFLYKDATVFLQRKFDKYQEFLDEYQKAKELVSVRRLFTNAQIQEIRIKYITKKYTYAQLAKEYNCHKDTIRKLIKKLQYK